MTGTFGDSRPAWLDHLGRVRNVVRQELIARQLDRHLATGCSVLDVGAGQGTQSLRLARDGHQVVAVEPDPVMRAAFTTALAAEPSEVRSRVTLVDAGVEGLDAVPGPFDAVLALGVLMYVPDPAAAVTALAARVAPRGRLALAVRTTTSAVWRPAARQDWFAARAAIAEDRAAHREGRDVAYVNEIGAAARALDLPTLLATCAAAGLDLERWYGIRVAVDAEELDPLPPADPEEFAALLEVEDHLASHDPFRQLGQLAHVVLRRPVEGQPV